LKVTGKTSSIACSH